MRHCPWSRLRPPPEFCENPLDWFEKEARISRRYDNWVRMVLDTILHIGDGTRYSLADHCSEKPILEPPFPELRVPAQQVINTYYRRRVQDFTKRTYYRVCMMSPSVDEREQGTEAQPTLPHGQYFLTCACWAHTAAALCGGRRGPQHRAGELINDELYSWP
jgi:hypothetical protein